MPRFDPSAVHGKQVIRNNLIEHECYIAAHVENMPEVREWRWRLAA